MSANGKLRRWAEQQGVPLDELLPRTLERVGTAYKVAVEAGVYPAAIQWWLDRNGYAYDKENGKWTKVASDEAPR